MRVFLSSTSEDLRPYREAAREAILDMHGLVPVAMESFPAAPIPPLAECLALLRDCDVCVVIIARRYGSVPPGEQRSYTELEYRAAAHGERPIPVFAFFLDERAAWPDEHTDGGEQAERLAALKREIPNTCTPKLFAASPDHLRAVVTAALGNYLLGLKHESAQNPTDAQQEEQRQALEHIRAEQREAARHRAAGRERVVNRPPSRYIERFQDRVDEVRRLRDRIADLGLRVIVVGGRGGAGKTALVAKLISDLEGEFIPDHQARAEAVDSIVFVSLREPESRAADRIVELVGRTLEADQAEELRQTWKHKTSLAAGLDYLFRQVLARRRRVIVLDNFESVLDDSNRVQREYAGIQEFIEACLDYDHSALVVATSREALVLPPELAGRTMGRRENISLDAGLPEPAAIALLRALDRDGRFGIKDAPDDALARVVQQCQRIPRTLEALVGLIAESQTTTLADLLADPGALARFAENPARELYASLRSNEERLVTQALAVYDAPVPAAAVRHLLPAFPVDELLAGLVRRYAVSFDHGRFSLHPLDRQYAYAQIPDEGEDYSKAAMHLRAASFYRELELPGLEWKSIEDLAPQMQRFHHLVRAGLHDEAAHLLHVVDDRYLRVWGNYDEIIGARKLLVDSIKSPLLAARNAGSLGSAYAEIGMADEATPHLERALASYREEKDRVAEGRTLDQLGLARTAKGDYAGAEEYHRQAVEIARAIRDRQGEAGGMNNLAAAIGMSGDQARAMEYKWQGLELDRQLSNRREEGIDLGNIGFGYYVLGQTTRAIELHSEALAIAEEVSDTMRQGAHRGNLARGYIDIGRLGDAERLLQEAVVIARRVGDRLRLSLNLAELGGLRVLIGDTAGAEALISDAIDVAVRIGYPRGQIRGLLSQGLFRLAQGDAGGAVCAFGRARDLSTTNLDGFQLSRSLAGLAWAHQLAGDTSTARRCCIENIAMGFPTNAYQCAVRLGVIGLMEGDSEGARQLERGAQLCRDRLAGCDQSYDALHYLGLAQAAGVSSDSALDAYRRAAGLCSAPGVVALALADLRMLERVAGQRDTTQAVMRFLETVSPQPD